MWYLYQDCIYARLVDSNVFKHHIVFQNRQGSEATGVTVLHQLIEASLCTKSRSHTCMSFKFVSASFLWVKAFTSITKHYFSITYCIKDLSFREKPKQWYALNFIQLIFFYHDQLIILEL